MNNKSAWGVVNKGTLNITEAFIGGDASGLPAIFKTRKAAREYVANWHGAEAHRVTIQKVLICEPRPADKERDTLPDREAK
jgi:hypothetical protein